MFTNSSISKASEKITAVSVAEFDISGTLRVNFQ